MPICFCDYKSCEKCGKIKLDLLEIGKEILKKNWKLLIAVVIIIVVLSNLPHSQVELSTSEAVSNQEQRLNR